MPTSSAGASLQGLNVAPAYRQAGRGLQRGISPQPRWRSITDRFCLAFVVSLLPAGRPGVSTFEF